MNVPKLFDFMESLSYTKKDLIRNSDDPAAAEKVYAPWVINLGFSQHVDTILYANDVNKMGNLPARKQHDYYLHSLKPKKRWGKWAKSKDDEAVDAVQDHYRINRRLAREVVKTLKPDAVEAIIREQHDASEAAAGVQAKPKRR